MGENDTEAGVVTLNGSEGRKKNEGTEDGGEEKLGILVAGGRLF